MIYCTSYEEQCYDVEQNEMEQTGAEVVEDPGISIHKEVVYTYLSPYNSF